MFNTVRRRRTRRHRLYHFGDRNPERCSHRAGGIAGIGQHQGVVCRFQHACEEGAGSGADRPATVPGARGPGARQSQCRAGRGAERPGADPEERSRCGQRQSDAGGCEGQCGESPVGGGRREEQTRPAPGAGEGGRAFQGRGRDGADDLRPGAGDAGIGAVAGDIRADQHHVHCRRRWKWRIRSAPPRRPR